MPGAWKVWEGTWLYATKTPGWLDVKVIMKGPFRSGSEGMGNMFMSKTLTPDHYGDDWNEPVETMLLLRSLCVWTARLGGWAKAAQPGRP